MAGTKILVLLSIGFCAWTRSAGVAYFGSAALLVALSVKNVLKKIIKQPRPNPLKATYGMPSTHSTVITFYFSYIYLAATRLPIHHSLPDSPYTRVIPPICAVVTAVTVTGSRVWKGVHTWTQVGVGCAYGATCAVIAYRLWIGGLNEHGEILEQWVDNQLTSLR